MDKLWTTGVAAVQGAVVDYQIRTASGLSVSLPADNWIEAFGRALAIFGRDASQIAVLAVHRVDGRFYIEDSRGDAYIVQESSVLGVVAVPPRVATPAPATRRRTTWVPPDAAPPPLDVPRPARLDRARGRVADPTS